MRQLPKSIGPEKPLAHANDWLAVLLLWAAGICAALQFGKVAVAFEPLGEALGATPEAIGALMGAAGIAGVFLGLAGATLASRLGFGRVLLASLVIAAGLSLIQAMMPAYPVFYGLRLLEGVTNLFIVIAAPTLIVQQAPRRHLAIALGLWSTFYGAAFALAAAAAPLLLAPAGPHVLFVAHAATCLVLAVLLRDIRLGVARADSQWRVLFLAFGPAAHKSAYGQLRIVLPGAVFLFHATIYLGLIVFLPQVAADAPTGQALAVSMPIASLLGTLLSGPLAQTAATAPGRWLVAGFGLEAIGAFVLLTGLSGWGFGAVGAAMALTAGMMQGMVFILVPRLGQSLDEEALGFGVIVQTGGLANIASPILFAALVNAGGKGALICGVTVCACLGAMMAGWGLSRLAKMARSPV